MVVVVLLLLLPSEFQSAPRNWRGHDRPSSGSNSNEDNDNHSGEEEIIDERDD